MKRIISLVLCVLMLAGMCACQKAEEAPAPTATPAPTAEPAAVETEQPAAPEPVAAPEGIGSYADAYLLYRSIWHRQSAMPVFMPCSISCREYACV